MSGKSVLERVQGLYSKDPSMQRILSHSHGMPKVYAEADGVPLPVGNPIRNMTGLPCLPYSKICQVAGKPDTGKSTTAAEVMAAAQKNGFEVVVWDAEDKLDLMRFAVEFGGTPEALHLIKTNEIRKGGQLVKDYINVLKEDNPDAKILVVWDSVGASVSRSETERNLADERHGQPGQDAKEAGSVVRHIVGMFNKYPDSISVLLVNQTYAKIGFMQHGEQAKGGSGIEYFSSLIIGLKRIKTLTRTEKKVKVKYGIITRATVTKNHLSTGKTSVYQMDFCITAAGSQVSDLEVEDDEDSEG
jgi:recombination protein RecA